MEIIDFIGIWKNLLSETECKELIDYIDNNKKTPSFQQSTLIRKDLNCILKPYNNISVKTNDKLNCCLFQYKREYSSLLESNYSNPEIVLQKTEPCGGYHVWHCENVGINFCFRALAWMIYLNDVPGDEGETEFLYQKLRVKPEQGKLLIWPAGFTHTHRGNPVYTQNKYIATGWFYYAPEGGIIIQG